MLDAAGGLVADDEVAGQLVADRDEHVAGTAVADVVGVDLVAGQEELVRALERVGARVVDQVVDEDHRVGRVGARAATGAVQELQIGQVAAASTKLGRASAW